MTAQIRAELLKIRTTRTTIGLIIGMMALIVLFTLLSGLLSRPSRLASREDQRELLSLSSLTGVFSALAGVMLVTSEYRFGTIRPTFLFNPVRSRVLAAKVAGAHWPESRSGSSARPSAGRSDTRSLKGAASP
jgi:ABC-2 type transport system permease protein